MQIEFPAVPGAAQDFVFTPPDESSRLGWQGGAAELAPADGRKRVRADIQHRHNPGTGIKYADGFIGRGDDPALAGRKIRQFRYEDFFQSNPSPGPSPMHWRGEVASSTNEE